MPAVKNLVGQRFGNLTVISLAPRDLWCNKNTHWVCKCDCGITKIICGESLRSGHTRSCGCHISKENRVSIKCELCGTVVPRTGNRQKYCVVCAPIINRQNALERWIKNHPRKTINYQPEPTSTPTQTLMYSHSFAGARHIYEEYHGVKLPAKYRVTHLDGDTTNNHPDNLFAVPECVISSCVHDGFHVNDGSLNKTVLQTYYLSYLIKKAKADYQKTKFS